jgi:hypothetical protein
VPPVEIARFLWPPVANNRPSDTRSTISLSEGEWLFYGVSERAAAIRATVKAIAFFVEHAGSLDQAPWQIGNVQLVHATLGELFDALIEEGGAQYMSEESVCGMAAMLAQREEG